MTNDPELNGKYLGTITSDFVKVADMLKEASYQVRKQKFSKYPIFPISKEEIPIGQILYEAGTFGNDWHYYVTYIDEFVQRKIVADDRIEDFEKSYKDPDEFCCLFVVDKDFASFVYVPYPDEL